MHTTRCLLLALLSSSTPGLHAAVDPLPWPVPAAVADAQDCQVPDRVQPAGWIGSRVTANAANRLVKIDPARLLEGYRKRPGRQTWDGEHVGKWLHAATLAWVNTGDPALRAKLDYTVAELAKCQLADGYLGTYADKDRWTEWDVWAHKYNLLGLLTYIQYTGNQQPMPACRKMADLLCDTFGDTPGKRDLILAGQHVGMAPTSVLEPMVLLYRMSGDPRYLEFCHYILRAWEQANGPHIVSRLLELKRVDKVGNSKAYEMLSCLNGALEYYRLTGERPILDACLNAWRDIVDHRLYLTGAASYGEHFHDDFDLPNNNNVGETCVTVTWLQFNAQLLRLTGEARFAEQLERVVLNQLFGAQRPDGAAWGYYVQMEGTKPYSATFDGHCCLSSGPRGVALIPTFAVSTDAAGPVINLYEAGQAALTLRDGTAVGLTTETTFPASDHIRITVNPSVGKRFTLKLRLPEWCAAPAVTVAGKPVPISAGRDGYLAIHRDWRPGEVVEVVLPMRARVVVGDHLNQGKIAVCYGPLVLAADNALLGDSGLTTNTLNLAGADPEALQLTPAPATGDFLTWQGARLFRVNAIARETTASLQKGAATTLRLVPFADAGATGQHYKVWLPLPAH
ncbi:MAG: beta-L-arabinofuranosidase domain-containing protein [Verrucomicrobiota bacterium]